MRCPIRDYRVRPGTDFTHFDETEVTTWIRSVAARYDLEAGTVRKVCSTATSGKALAKLTAALLSKPAAQGGWGLHATQATSLAAAVDALKEMCYGDGGDGDDGPAVHVDLAFYWPKLLEPGRRTARASRYPFETPLASLSGWDRIEDATGVDIPSESKLGATKALCAKILEWTRGAKHGVHGQPLMQRATDWLDRYALELVPELQDAIILVGEGAGAGQGAEPKAAAVVADVAAPAKPTPRASSAAPRQPDRPSTRPAAEKSAEVRESKADTPAKAPQAAPAASTNGGSHSAKASARGERRPETAKVAPSTTSDAPAAHARVAAEPSAHALAQKAREDDKRQARKAAKEKTVGQQLKEHFKKHQTRPNYKKMLAGRRTLPAMAQHDEVVDAIRDHQVTVISGATGCGKSTQVPQFVLDDLVARGLGGSTNLICTQPRRLAAIGVSERVASERDEECGKVVGYQIRLEQKRSKATRLLFCTTGILLRTLESDSDLRGLHDDEPAVTHVFVDEVHERRCDSSLLP